jgi:acyl-CoA synthetase (AMP-forming)/AMP-acid ligase II
VLAPGAQLGADDLISWSREAMANYKVPRAVEFIDELPTNATGKVEKETLRARATSSGGRFRSAVPPSGQGSTSSPPRRA